MIEPLEARIAPATFSAAGTALTINLNNANEAIDVHTDGTAITVAITGGTAVDGGGTGGLVTGFGTSSAVISSPVFTSVSIIDGAAGVAVTFSQSTGSYTQPFTVTLDDAASGNVAFTGASTFPASLSVATAGGFIASDAASALTLSGAGSNLTLTATGHDVLFKGSVAVGGATLIDARVIDLAHPANDFTGAFRMTNPFLAGVQDANDIVLGATSLAFGIPNRTVHITAGGNITQAGALTATASLLDTVRLDSTGGSIMLTNPGNHFASTVALSFSVTGSNPANISNSASTPLLLGDVQLGTATLTITATGGVTQQLGTTIETGGSITAIVGANNRDIILASPGNEIAGPVLVGESAAGFLRDVALRNAHGNALLPTGTALATAGNVRNLTLFFDHTGIALAGYAVANNLTVTAGGDITQTAPLSVPGNATFSLIGDHAINLTNATNVLGGKVSFNTEQSTQPVQVVSNPLLTFDASSLGRGAFSATSLQGDIAQSDGITQQKGAAPATFMVTAGSTINLSSNNNRFTGGLVFAGGGLNTVHVRNGDPTADFSDLTLPASVQTLTVRFDGAAVALPSLGSPGTPLTSLTVTAPGIAQKAGASINAITASFTSLSFPLDLSNANNDFTNLTVVNTGRNEIKITDIDDLNFAGLSVLGTGRLTVTAGAITDSGTISQNATPAGDVTFTSSGSITLDGGHGIRGAVSMTVTGSNSATFRNAGVALTLGAISVGSGTLSALAGSEGIFQDPNSVLNLGGGGLASFSAPGGPIKLDNATNTFNSVGLTGKDVSLHATGAVNFASSAVTSSLAVKTGGAAGHAILQSGAITGNARATFDAGAAGISLILASNDFASVSLFSTAPVQITDANALDLGILRVGPGPLDIVTNGALGTAAGGSFVKTGASTLTLTTGGNSITLNAPGNDIRGLIHVVNANGVTVVSKGDLSFAVGSSIAGALNAISGGTLSLPNNLTGLASLTTSAVSTTLGVDVTTAGALSMAGAVTLNGPRVLTAGTFISLVGDVDVHGPLTLSAASQIAFDGGTWHQGTQPFTVTTSAQVVIGGGSPHRARFIAAGTLTMAGGDFSVFTNGTLQAGETSSPETLTIANGAGRLILTGDLEIGFGATNDRVIKTGSGLVSIADGISHLRGTGLAGAPATPVLISQTGLLVGRFVGSVDAADAPHDFFAGSDIVTPAYDFTQLTVKTGGTASATGTITGILPDGDQYTVSSTLGAAAGLAIVEEANGQLSVVVRNATATAASKLAIATAGGGDGLLSLRGVTVNTPGAVTVTAPAANISDSLSTAGTLTALTVRDLVGVSSMQPFQLTDGGPATASTTLTARVVKLATMHLAGTLGAFKATAVNESVEITALKFGTITTTGNPLGTDPALPGVPNPGNFEANLVSSTTADGTVVNTVKVAGTLAGTWDLRGTVGSVTAPKTSFWNLGTLGGAAKQNGGLFAGAKALTLGMLNDMSLHATGAIGTLSAVQLDSVTLTAGSYGTVKTTGSATLGSNGTASNFILTATGNAGGVALKSLSIAGDLIIGTLYLLDGDATSITVGRSVNGANFMASDINKHGNLKAVSAASWQTLSIDARSIGTLKATGNLAAGLFGNFTSASVTVRGNNGGIGLATFDAQGAVLGASFAIQHGNLTTFKAGRALDSVSISLPDAAFGNLGTIQAGEWANNVTVLAKTIGTLASVGAAAVNPASPLLTGGMSGDTITAYLNTGTAPAIGKLSVKGDFDDVRVNAEHGLGSLTVGRSVTGGSIIVADDALAGALNVGRVATLTAGAWNGSSIVANTLGTVKITGATQPDSPSGIFFLAGDVATGTFVAQGATPSKTGIDSFTIARHFQSNSVVSAPSGIKTLAIGGAFTNGSVLADQAANPAAGALGTLTVGEMAGGALVRAGSIGTLKVTGSVALGLLGNINASAIYVTSGATVAGAPQAIGMLTVAGDFHNSLLDAAATVVKIDIAGQVSDTAANTRIQAGYAAGSKLGSFTAASLGVAGSTFTTDVVAQSIGTFTLKGNAARGIAGAANHAFIDILGNAGGIGLGTFSATGTATDSLFRVSDGDVTSFTVQRLVSSDVLVGFRIGKEGDITNAPAAAQWTATNHKLGTFKTTAPFDPADVDDSASFVDSNVIAGILGSITISGVHTASLASTAYGIAFRTSAGAAAAGTVKINGSAVALTAPATSGQFNYLGLVG